MTVKAQKMPDYVVLRGNRTNKNGFTYVFFDLGFNWTIM